VRGHALRATGSGELFLAYQAMLVHVLRLEQESITVNGEQYTRDVEPRMLLVHFLRDTLDLTGTHWGCDTSNCGACVVLMDGKPIKSCTTLAAMCEGHEIRTVESLEVDGKLQQEVIGREIIPCDTVVLAIGGAPYAPAVRP
jgi:xanthine dehydrogenase iron-sulfur cluster and FAD-binding subunit A